MKCLVAGWFSFDQMGASAGDLLARDLACEWLERAGFSYDVALAPPFRGGVDWRFTDPKTYSHVLFVCGPFGNGEPITEFLSHFSGCSVIGLNITMLESLNVWNPFDVLFERDSSVTSRPDITFLSCQSRVPVVGIVLIDTQPEYKEKDLHLSANEAINKLVASREMTTVPIDTRLDINRTSLRSPAEVESLIAAMDLVLTTRLHGLVLALKNDVPAIAFDSVSGGAKIKRQAETIGWPIVFTVDSITDEALLEAYDYCLTEDARKTVKESKDKAVVMVQKVREEFIEAMIRSFGKVR
ncbi:MAG: hypothetical protein A2W09_07430 [Deltaproteobacteria bacterium RBG_16_50_11]|nr:MAG: hypothetical protein A2W09_07430 [Deltaproteobacteria bacterium RBG_16_50_11]